MTVAPFADRPWLVPAVAAVTAILVVTAGFSPPSAASPDPGVTSIPLATSLQSAAGTWATLPMGHLTQPLNTFWQLFFRPTGTTAWANEVDATATATNGGLVLASAAGQPFIAAVRPANLLHFSPLISTTDGGRSWSNGLLPKGLGASPDALSTAPGGPTLALVESGLHAQVLASAGDLSTWRTLTTARRLASGEGGTACGLLSLTAVASLAGHAIVGASCSRPGVVGIFTARGSTWTLDRLTLPRSIRQGRVQVLALEGSPSGLSALLASTAKSGTTLVAARTDGTGWTVSPGPVVAPGRHLISFGPTAGTGLFALLSAPSGAVRLVVDSGSGGAWQQMPSPPPGTATVAFDPDAAPTVAAFAVHKSTVTVWTLAAADGQWAKGQVIHVKIQFGSSA